MLLIAAVATLALAISLVLTPMCRNIALRSGLVDKPDYGRKIHRHPVPRVGGVPILVAMGFAVCALGLLYPDAPLVNSGAWTKLTPALAVVFLTGLFDDLMGLKPWQKLTGQIAAAALACGFHVQIETIAGHNIGNTWWHLPLTMVWLIGCTNAFNLIDGVDGLASGIGLFATLTTLIAALLGSNLALALATAPLAGALLGFLRYNFNPASIFLGDCGSLSIGFLLGCYGIIWSQKSATLLGITAPLIALCIPILEAGLSVIRRFLRGRPIFGADRRHIHHRLLDLGFTSRGVVLVMYGVAGVAAGCSLLITVSNTRFAGVIVVLFCVGAWIGVQHLGYGEFAVARHVFFGGIIRNVIDTEVLLRQLDAGLCAARSNDERWKLLAAASRNIGFNEFDLHLDGRRWHETYGPLPASQCWRMEIPLRGSGQARFSIPIGGPIHPVLLAPFAAIVLRNLGTANHPSAKSAPVATMVPEPAAANAPGSKSASPLVEHA